MKHVRRAVLLSLVAATAVGAQGRFPQPIGTVYSTHTIVTRALADATGALRGLMPGGTRYKSLEQLGADIHKWGISGVPRALEAHFERIGKLADAEEDAGMSAIWRLGRLKPLPDEGGDAREPGIGARFLEKLGIGVPRVRSTEEIIRRAAAKHGVDADLAIAVMQTEPHGDPNPVSKKRARGLM